MRDKLKSDSDTDDLEEVGWDCWIIGLKTTTRHASGHAASREEAQAAAKEAGRRMAGEIENEGVKT